MEISIRHIGGRIVNNYLLDTPLGVIAIDTGYSGGMERFRARFEKYWPLSRLTYLFLTHHHDDHDHDNYHDGDHDHHRRAASCVVGRCGPVLLRREEAGGNRLTERMYG